MSWNSHRDCHCYYKEEEKKEELEGTSRMTQSLEYASHALYSWLRILTLVKDLLVLLYWCGYI